MLEYRLDRTIGKGQTLAEASNQKAFYQKLTWQERLTIAAYLNSVAYGYDMNCPPKLDKTKFSARSSEG